MSSNHIIRISSPKLSVNTNNNITYTFLSNSIKDKIKECVEFPLNENTIYKQYRQLIIMKNDIKNDVKDNQIETDEWFAIMKTINNKLIEIKNSEYFQQYLFSCQQKLQMLKEDEQLLFTKLYLKQNEINDMISELRLMNGTQY